MLTLAKTIGLAILKFFTFIIDVIRRYPLQILLVLVCWYAYNKTMQHDAIVQDYKLYKADVKHKAELQILQDNLMRKQADRKLKEAETIYDINLEAVKNEFIKKHKVDSITIGDLRNRLHDKISADSFTLPETPPDTETNPEVWRERYSALARQYDTLKYGTALTTSDFNVCRKWMDIVCDQVGCEPSL